MRRLTCAPLIFHQGYHSPGLPGDVVSLTFRFRRARHLPQTASGSHYPGDCAAAEDIYDLAIAYHAAAKALFPRATKGAPLSYAPARLCSIHAIELCLNAYLRLKGMENCQIRARMHDLADTGFVADLRLRKKTAAHLQEMTQRREYLISRYAPESAGQHTELTRLTATLDEVVRKVGRYIEQAGGAGARGRLPADAAPLPTAAPI